MATKALFLLLLVPVLSVRPPRNYLLRTSTQPLPPRPAVRDVKDNLILTDYLEAGKIEEAQNLSRVRGSAFPDDIPSYSGFFTVDKSIGGNTFFWFFPAENDYENAPVLLWLQGGPGYSSLYGLFIELGPFSVSDDASKLIKNPYSWHRNHSLLFIDNPLGSGFSYTTNNTYRTDETQIGQDLYSAIVQFFTLFPNLQKNDFFISGESYAGKYNPALGHTIHKNNPNSTVKINLKGIIIGDGVSDPINQLDLSDYVYQVGLVDNNTWTIMKGREKKMRQLITEGQYKKAAAEWSGNLEVYQNASHLGYYNFIFEEDGSYSYFDFLEKNSTRAALHVGTAQYEDMNESVYNYLQDDMMQSVAKWIEELLDAGYRVIFYNGQLDVSVPYPVMVNVCRSLKFKDADAYKTAKRNLWANSTHVFGYTKTAGGLTEVLVRNAGHMVPIDLPAVAFDLIYKATRGEL